MRRFRQVPKSPVSAAKINHGIAARDILDKITVAAPLEIRNNGDNGIAISLAMKHFDGGLGIADGSIAAGTLASPTTGSVYLAKRGTSGWSSTGYAMSMELPFNANGGTGIADGTTVVWILLNGIPTIVGWDC